MIAIKRSFATFCRERDVLLLWLIALSIFMFGIWQQPFVNFETRFAVFAQEMLRHGLTLFPTTYGQPYPDYPVTSTVLIWLASLPFGQVTKFSAVLPTALASSTIVALTYKLLAQYSKQWGVLAVGFELLTVSFLAESRSISVDQILSAITVSAFYLTHKSYRNGLPLPTRNLVLLLVAGFLVRGPIGIVLPAGVVLSHLLLTSERRVVVAFSAWSSTTLILCGATLWGLAVFIYGSEFASNVIRMQIVGRFAESTPLPRYYYFTSSFGNYALSYPIAVIVAASALFAKFKRIAFNERNDRTSIVLLLVAWMAIVFVGLSIPETKKVRYILPAAPALAALASYIFLGSGNALLKWTRRCVELILVTLPLLAVAFVYLRRSQLVGYGISVDPAICIFIALFLCQLAIMFFVDRNGVRRSIGLVFIGVFLVLYATITMVEPIDLRIHDTSRFVQHIESLREKQPGNVVFYKENPDALPIKYLVNVKGDLLPEFIADLDSLGHNQSPIWLLTKEKNIDDLKAIGLDAQSQIVRDHFGDLPFVAVYVPTLSATTVRP